MQIAKYISVINSEYYLQFVVIQNNINMKDNNNDDDNKISDK